MSIRTERVAGEVQQALGTLFQRDFANLSDGMITVTKVRMAPDLRSAKVYVSIFGGVVGPQGTLKAIQTEIPRLRAGVARSVRLKFVPELYFYIDDTQEEVSRVEEIFRRIRPITPEDDGATELPSAPPDAPIPGRPAPNPDDDQW